MICPPCHKDIPTFGDAIEHFGFRAAAKALGSRGGRVKGKSKIRDVDYVALARLSHQKRRENKG